MGTIECECGMTIEEDELKKHMVEAHGEKA